MHLTLLETSVIEELERRSLINNIIDYLLANLFSFTENQFHKVKRGQVHQEIANELNVDVSNTLCNTIRERIELQGGKPKTVGGTHYYLHMVRKGRTP